MKINLESLYLKGFMSFLEENSIDFTEYAGKSVQIDGLNNDDEKSKSNGSGKSTLLEAINWGFYGELCRRNRFNDEVIHKQAKEATVQILFTIDDVKYKIARFIGRKKAMDVKIYQSPEELLKSSTYKVKQDYIEKLIGMNFTAFQCTEIFGRDFMNFPDLKPSERAKILSEVRGLEKYTEASKRAFDSAKLVGTNVEELALSLSKEEGRLGGVRTTSYKDSIQSWEKDRNDFITYEEETIRIWNEDILVRTQTLEKSNLEKKTLIDTLSEELKTLLKSLPDRMAIQNNINEANEGLTKTLAKISELSGYIMNRVKDIDNLTRAGEGPCPFCNQAISGEYLTKRINQLGLEKMQFQTDLAIVKANQNSWSEIIQKNKEILNSGYLMEKEIKEKEKLIQRIASSIIDISSDKQILTDKLSIQNSQTKIAEKKSETNPYIALEEQRKEKIKEIGATIRKIKSDIAKAKEDKKYYEFWIDGYKKIRMMIFDTMIADLESLSQQFLSNYSSELNIVMSTERETRSGTIKDEFNISIVDSNGFEISYEMYSGGERQKVRLSIARALSQLIKDKCGRDFNFIAFDEPNDALDDVGKSVNFDTFQELSDQGKMVLVTDHDALFKDRFDYNIMVVKTNGASKINA